MVHLWFGEGHGMTCCQSVLCQGWCSQIPILQGMSVFPKLVCKALAILSNVACYVDTRSLGWMSRWQWLLGRQNTTLMFSSVRIHLTESARPLMARSGWHGPLVIYFIPWSAQTGVLVNEAGGVTFSFWRLCNPLSPLAPCLRISGHCLWSWGPHYCYLACPWVVGSKGEALVSVCGLLVQRCPVRIPTHMHMREGQSPLIRLL